MMVISGAVLTRALADGPGSHLGRAPLRPLRLRDRPRTTKTPHRKTMNGPPGSPRGAGGGAFAHQPGMVIPHPDYCSFYLSGLPSSVLQPLQPIQNETSAGFDLPESSRIPLILVSLHWLPAVARIKFNTLVMACKVVKGSAT
ncbi:hypothetical protein Z043_122992 [Scleropages formosus]|uniref:Uncharacterized protein n=1 Tax=Scleropages formosus TaxID=113540 RepID=A0A0P7UIY6_SCLFO|nr:hypothetical protein Z043_122992 [Scleropages formosus]